MPGKITEFEGCTELHNMRDRFIYDFAGIGHREIGSLGRSFRRCVESRKNVRDKSFLAVHCFKIPSSAAQWGLLRIEENE